MNLRLVSLLTILLTGAISVLLAFHLSSIFPIRIDDTSYFPENQVHSVKIIHNQNPYLLNFEQQHQLIEILNHSVRVVGFHPKKHLPTPIEKIVIERFERETPIIVVPVSFLDNNLVFTVPEWDENGYFMEVSNGVLQRLISDSYDP